MRAHGLPILALAAVTACKLDKLSIRTLRFKPATGGSVLAHVLTGPPAYVSSDADFAAVRGVCADSLAAELDAPNPLANRLGLATTTEVQLYARRFNEMHDLLAAQRPNTIFSGLAQTSTSRRFGTWSPYTVVPSAFPRVPTLAATSPGSLGPLVTRALSSAEMWGFGPFGRGVPAEAITCRALERGERFGGSIKTVVAYNRGICAQEVTYADFVTNQHQELAQAIHAATAGGIGSNTINYSILNSYMRHEESALDSPTGGLFLFLHVTSRDLAGGAPGDTWGVVRYELGLAPGAGTVRIQPRQIAWHHDVLWGRHLSEGLPPRYPGLRHQLTDGSGRLVNQVQAALLQKQLASVQSGFVSALLASSEFDCDRSSFRERCGRAAQTLADALHNLLSGRRRPDGGPAFIAAEVERMKCALGSPAACTAIGKDATSIIDRRWACTDTPNSERDHCDLIVPISRLLPQPDGVTAVLFDGDDLDNAAYVLEAASPGAVCQPPPTPATRQFISHVIEDPRR